VAKYLPKGITFITKSDNPELIELYFLEGDKYG